MPSNKPAQVMFPNAPDGVTRNVWGSGDACTYTVPASYPDRACVITAGGHLYTGFGAPKTCRTCRRTATYLAQFDAVPCTARATVDDVLGILLVNSTSTPQTAADLARTEAAMNGDH